MSNRNEISDGLWLRNVATQNGIPADCIRPYRMFFNQGVAHFDDVITQAGGSIELPMQPALLENYLTGYTFEHRTFCNLYEFDEDTEGFWQIDPADNKNVIIHYNRCTAEVRQRNTQVHELLHFVQTIDPPFLDFLDSLIYDTALPEYVVAKLLHRITERATVMYLMPNDFFRKKYQEIQAEHPIFGEGQLKQLARIFDVSIASARYRIQEVNKPIRAYSSAGVMPP